MSQFGPYSASKAAPPHRQPCQCDAWPFPHKQGRKCADLAEALHADEHEYDLIDESREQEARHQNYLSGR